jgi:alpha-L-rhamnosidase
MTIITHLRTENLIDPIGIDSLHPRLSWKMESARKGTKQSAYQIIGLQAGSPHWDSGRVESDQSAHIPYDGKLHSRDRIDWTVRVWDETGTMTESSPAVFEMGLLEPSAWQAKWIANPLRGGARTSSPCPFFRKGFLIEREIRFARLYVTALGIYEATLNGRRVGEDVFAPGWTDYHKRVQYQTYDVTELLSIGENKFDVVLGDGWYCGHIAWLGRQQYGERPKLLAQLEINFSDGSRQTIVSGETWQTAVGATLESDLIMGEAYDARLELGNWSPVMLCSVPPELALVAQNTPTVRAQGELTPIAEPAIVWGWPEHDWLFDFGQNLVGRVRLKVKGARGTTLTLRFGEVCDENGKLYTKNLRTARQTDYYTLSGDPNGEIWESRFTFHGFRYVQVNGLTEPPNRDLLTAIVLHSDTPTALDFECSDLLLNQLHHNIQWGWKGNSVDIPTDCPQRDERLGWTGDAQVFARTAAYLTDSAGFFPKWIQDMADAQLASGAIPSVAPVISTLNKSDGGAAWSDAFIIVPWTIWQHYGDTRVLATHYTAMCRYMDYLTSRSKDLIRLLPDERELPKAQQEWQLGGYGDWLAQDGSTDKRGFTPRDLLGTAFLAYDAHLMSQIATALGKEDDAGQFAKLFDDIRAAFVKRFITPDGLLIGQQQTGYILALHFNLVPEHLRPNFIAALVKDIEMRNLHMSTGFVGTPYICQVLTDLGRLDLAYALLLQKTFPSWLYSVLHGATTIWERWDGWTETKGFQDPEMNSFNHYAYGAVGTWMYENITGIRAAQPGFKKVVLQPRPGGGLTYARGEYKSIHGMIKSHWRMNGDSLNWDISLPPNVTAEAFIPALACSSVTESDTPLEQTPGVKFLRQTDNSVVVELQSGEYQFKVMKE